MIKLIKKIKHKKQHKKWYKTDPKYRYWYDKAVSKEKPVEHVIKASYELMVSLAGGPNIGSIHEFKMESGKTGLYELLYLKMYSDPWDMIKEARLTFIGYKGAKPMADCSFEEFCEIY